MSKTTSVVSEQTLKKTPLPLATETYTVISHEFIIENVKQGLLDRGFSLLESEYRANHNCDVARGTHIIQHGEDPEMKMIFSWVNSYDKSTKFQCGIGACNNLNSSYMMSQEMTNWIRKHTGSADSEALEIITGHLDQADEYFKSLMSDKEQMKNIMVTPDHYYSVLGKLYFTNALSTQQLSAIKAEYLKPTYVYTTEALSLWTLYNHVMVVIKGAHPKNWLKQQTHIHYVFKNEFSLVNYAYDAEEEEEEDLNLELVDPLLTNYGQPENQTNLLKQIAEVEGGGELPDIMINTELLTKEEILEKYGDSVTEEQLDELTKAQYPVMESEAIAPEPLISAKAVVFDLAKPEEGITDLEEFNRLMNTEEVVHEEVKGPELGPNVGEVMSEEEFQALYGGDPPIPAIMERIEEGHYPKKAQDMTDAELREEFPHLNDEEFIKLNTPQSIEKDPYMVKKAQEEHDAAIHKIAENMKEKDPETYKAIADLAEAEEKALVFGIDHEEKVLETAPNRVKFAIDETEEKSEPTIDLSEIEGEYSLDEMPAVLETIQEKIDEVRVPTVPLEKETSPLDFDFNPDEDNIEEIASTVEVKEDIITESEEIPVSTEDPVIKSIIANELEELFGASQNFTYKLIGDKYEISLEDGSSLELDKEYIDLLS
jgi:hypothetical protein